MISRDKYSSQQETLEKYKEVQVKRRERVEFPGFVAGRRPVAILFFGTILASVLFWLKGGVDWQGFNFFSSEKITFEKEDNERLVGEVEGEVNSLKGTYGIYIKELGGGREFGLNYERQFLAASVNKVPVVLYFYKQVEEGSWSLEQEYILKKEEIQDYGTGSMRYDSPGKSYSYEDLARLAMKKSDNTANFVLMKILGKENIQSWLDDLGLTETLLEDNLTTPKEMGRLFELLYDGEIVGEEYREEIFDMMTETDFEERLPKLLPEEVAVAHKIGNETGVYNDCGVVFADEPYVICILSEGVREAEAMEVIPRISKMVWEAMGE